MLTYYITIFIINNQSAIGLEVTWHFVVNCRWVIKVIHKVVIIG